MSADARFEKSANAAAEEILQRIYGDDYAGCTVSLDEIASIILARMQERLQEEKSILELYDKAVEGIQLLATPPEAGSSLTPEELQGLLSERLDTIHTLTGKIIATLASVKTPPDE
ncbi:MAG: hypothetical protein EOP84_07425 [Verrucomicrobiaceae bacterium]|nr:MAG: hypothetical protein EOP84_07425 [Verrucomicrobiaceae bacterium]